MIINGFQKLTLLDFPGHVACTIFTGGCNFRCPFCHNASLVVGEASEKYEEDEILAYLKKRKGILDGVAISGGEPLLQKDIIQFMKKVKDFGFKIKLDTNGSFPEKLSEIIDSGLCDYIAVDIKNSPNKYAETVGRMGYTAERIEETIRLLASGNIPYEFRTTVVKELHDENDIAEIGRWISGCDRWYLQSFVDSGDLICSDMHGVDADMMKQYIEIARKYVSSACLRGV